MSQIVIDSVAIVMRDTATNEIVEYRGNLGPVPATRSAQKSAEPARASPRAAAEKATPKKAAAKKRESSTAESETPKAKKTASQPEASPRDESPKAKKATGPRKLAELKWSPVQDAKYHGFAAPSGGGSFEVLRTRGTQWALFYVWKNKQWKMLGCFLELGQAQAKAERDHHKKMPERYDISAQVIASACPIPDGMKDEDIEPAKSAPAAAASEPPPAADEKPVAEQDKELLGSFAAELDTMLDEDDED